MNSFIVEEFYKVSKQFSEFFFRPVIPKKNPFVFQCTPGSFYKDVVLAVVAGVKLPKNAGEKFPLLGI